MKNEAEVLEMPRSLILKPVEWTEQRVELLKRTITPRECTDDEFQLFLEQCKHTGLNPFLKQAYMIERKQNVKDARGNWTEVKRFEFQAAEIGMAARANQFPDFRGMKGAAVFEKDIFEMDHAEGTVVHKSAPTKMRGQLLGAWAHATRERHDIPITWLDLSSRIQTTRDGKVTRFWATMPDGQIAKCARAEQYRLAYPQIFSGVYIPEEMPNESGGPTEPPPTKTPAKASSRTAEVKEQLSRQVKPKGKAPAKLVQNTPSTQTAQILAIGIGKRAGAVIAEMPVEDLTAAIYERTSFVSKNPKHKDVPTLKAELGALQAEATRRAEEPIEGEVIQPSTDTAEHAQDQKEDIEPEFV